METTMLAVSAIVVVALFLDLKRQIKKYEECDTVYRKVGKKWIKVEL